MNKTRDCEELIRDPDTGKEYLFAGTNGFLKALALAGRDPALIHNDLIDGLLPPLEIENVIKLSLEKVDNVDVTDENRDAFSTEFIEAAGLIDCSLVARLVMSHGMIGSIKKKRIAEQNQTDEILGMIIQSQAKARRSRLMLCTVIGWFLVGSTSGSIALACMIIKGF